MSLFPGPSFISRHAPTMFASDVPSTPVIDLCGPGVGASGQVLHVLRGHVLVEYIRDPVRSSYQ